VLPFKSKGNEGILTQHDDMICCSASGPFVASMAATSGVGATAVDTETSIDGLCLPKTSSAGFAEEKRIGS
jgi:hypothetical protein